MQHCIFKHYKCLNDELFLYLNDPIFSTFPQKYFDFHRKCYGIEFRCQDKDINFVKPLTLNICWLIKDCNPSQAMLSNTGIFPCSSAYSPIKCKKCVKDELFFYLSDQIFFYFPPKILFFSSEMLRHWIPMSRKRYLFCQTIDIKNTLTDHPSQAMLSNTGSFSTHPALHIQ